MFKQSLAMMMASIASARSAPDKYLPKTRYRTYGDPADKATERGKVRASVKQYASDEHAARAMKRYQRWVKNNPNRNLLDMPAHIHEKRVLLASVML